MSTTTFTGTIRSGKPGSTGVVSLNAVIQFDPTQASAGTGFVLPAGSVVSGIQSLGGATGGTTPTVHVGADGDPEFFASDLDADTAEQGTVLKFGYLDDDVEVWAGVGASAATGGKTTISIQYYKA